jgi:hypothetical protein
MKLPEYGFNAATICYGSDREPATIIHRKGKVLTVVTDRYTVVSGSPHDGSADYEYETDANGLKMLFRQSRSNPDRFEHVVRNTRTGRLRKSYGSLYVGRRKRYYDPHF